MIQSLFSNYVLKYPKFFLIVMIGFVAFCAYQAKNLEFDVSAETLLLENDKDLRNTRLFNERFQNSEFLFITIKPKTDLLSKSNLEKLAKITTDLKKLEVVDSVYSLINVPLLQSPPKPVKEIVKDVPTIEKGGVDLKLAKEEFLNSAIYKDLLVSQDFKTTAMQVNLKVDEVFRTFTKKLQDLRDKKIDGTLKEDEKLLLIATEAEFKVYRDERRAIDHENVKKIRAVIAKHKGDDVIFLGGVSMIADDMVTFLQKDIKYFGIGVLLLLIFTLGIIFRQLQWILVPVLTCAFSVIITTGFLGMFQWEITVISSNFISIQLIITMAITIHLIVHYRELIQEKPHLTQRELVLESVVGMWKPCLFATLTTIAGFSTLVLSGILPVINFGWMMSVGVSVSLIVTFLVFPVVVFQMKKLQANTAFEDSFAFTKVLANLTANHGRKIIIASIIITFLIIGGISQIIVENSFITYFKKSTEIFKGLEIIDTQLGGTTTIDIILDLNEEEKEVASELSSTEEESGDDDEDDLDDLFSSMEDDFDAEKSQSQYWFSTSKMQKIERIHNYLESLPETGKVLSLGTVLKVGRVLNEGKPLDNFKLALIYNKLPERFRKIILTPYVNIEHNQVRFAIRVVDTNPDLRRNQFIQKVRTDLHEKFGIPKDKLYLTNLLVLYNNVLQQLFKSQILTIGTVVIILMVMFLFLFKSIRVSLIAIFPNIIPVGVILGFMGWAGIPLDVMTITIASISIGIAVDDTIHYIHRIEHEFRITGNYLQAMHRSHESIGYAMYYTSVTIIIGFSILVISNFVPSIYFGLLTGVAMFVALLSDLTLLPTLIIKFKAFGPETNPAKT